MQNTSRLIVLAAFIALASTVFAQPAYNSAVEALSPARPSASIIRTLNQNVSVLCYYDLNLRYPCLIMVDALSGSTSPAVPLKSMAHVADMRIYNGNVYFCGYTDSTSSHPNSACYGFVDINSFWTSTPNLYSVEYRYFDSPPTNLKPTRMLVYHDGRNDKLILIGNDYFYSNDSSSLTTLLSSPINSYSSALSIRHTQYVLIECENPTSPNPAIKLLLVDSDNNPEYISDMTLTDSYVAIVGNDIDDYGVTYIHRCDRDNVVGTFNKRFEYPIPYPTPFSGYNCCALESDNIAITNISDASGYYGIRVRFIDLQSMTMTSAQETPIPEKTEIFDLAYHGHSKTLLILTLFDFLPTPYDEYVFLRIDRSASAPYITTGIVETAATYSYRSMDLLLGQQHFVATGGNYGFIKDVVTDATSPICYEKNSWPVDMLPVITITPNVLNYDAASWFVAEGRLPVDHLSELGTILCIE